jgi:hypothetical protein
MTSIDHSLIYQARKFINATNVHCVNTWLFCYQSSPDASRRKRYEELLRDFVATKNLTLGARMQAKQAVDRGLELRADGTAMDQVISQLI